MEVDGLWTAGWLTWMDVDGLEFDVNVEGLDGKEEAAADAEDGDGEGKGLLCGADGPAGGDMNEEEEDEVDVNVLTGPSSTRAEPQAVVLLVVQLGWMPMVLKSMLMLMLMLMLKMLEMQEDFYVEQTDPVEI